MTVKKSRSALLTALAVSMLGEGRGIVINDDLTINQEPPIKYESRKIAAMPTIGYSRQGCSHKEWGMHLQNTGKCYRRSHGKYPATFKH